jgi:hypothetical protein
MSLNQQKMPVKVYRFRSVSDILWWWKVFCFVSLFTKRTEIWPKSSCPFQQTFFTMAEDISTREYLEKWMDQYGWPPWTQLLRSVAFNIEKILFFAKQATLRWRSPILVLPLQLVVGPCCPCLEYWNTYRRGRVSTVDLLVLISSDQMLLILKKYFYFLQNKLPLRGGQLYWASLFC